MNPIDKLILAETERLRAEIETVADKLFDNSFFPESHLSGLLMDQLHSIDETASIRMMAELGFIDFRIRDDLLILLSYTEMLSEGKDDEVLSSYVNLLNKLSIISADLREPSFESDSSTLFSVGFMEKEHTILRERILMLIQEAYAKLIDALKGVQR